jgi:hypothetical protein
LKKVVSTILVLTFLLSFSGTVFASPETKSNNGTVKFDADVTKEKTEQNKVLLNKIKNDPDFEVFYDDGQGNASFAPSPKAKGAEDKKRIQAKLEEYSTQYSYSFSISGNKSLPYSDGNVMSWFTSNDNLSNGGAFTDDILAISGDSHSSWSGMNPFYASSIDQSDSFSVGYVGTTVFVSYPPGIGFTGSGSSCAVTYPQLNGNYWRYDHTYSGAQFKAYYITSTTQSDAATYRFGSNTVTPISNAYNSMPAH